jgi:uncharacterized protein
MQLFDSKLVYSATDLIGHGACSHMTKLSIAHKLELVDIEPVEIVGMAAIAAVRGGEHELNVLAFMKDQGRSVTDLSDLPHKTRAELVASAQTTKEALSRGDEVVYQGIVFDGTFLGYPDFLVRIDGPKYSRGFTYEVWDAKLKRSLSANAVMQMTAYGRQLNKLGFEYSDQIHAYLGDFSIASFYVSDSLPYLEKLTREYEQLLLAPAEVPSPTWASKVSACEMCKWSQVCETGREQARDLSLVAKLRSDQRKALNTQGIESIEQLASAGDEQKPPKMNKDTFERLRHQALLQSKQDNDDENKVLYEVFSDAGLALMPKVSPGDIWFDMEGDPFAEQPNGLEYLFGSITAESGDNVFTPFWAHSAEAEKQAFEQFVDWVESRRKTWPDLHIYHYASYERTRMGSLASRYGTREALIDDWLRNGVMIDLLKVVQRSIRISQRSYSIKKLEPLYGFTRTEDIKTAGDSVVDYEAYLSLTDERKTTEAQEKLDGIEKYNIADCISTRELDLWLRRIAADQGIAPLDVETSDATKAKDEQIEKLIAQLVAGVPVNPIDRNAQQNAQALMAAALGFHERESRVNWWGYFKNLEADATEWENDDKVAVVTKAKSSGWRDPVGKERARRRDVIMTVEGGHGLRYGGSLGLNVLFDTWPITNPEATGRYKTQTRVSRLPSGEVSFTQTQPKGGGDDWDALPVAVIESSPVNQSAVIAGVVEAANLVKDALPEFPHGPAFDILMRRQPGQGKITLHQTGNLQTDIINSLIELNNSYLAIQGPPGTGKTHISARIIKHLVEVEKWRIGVVSQSHKVIDNLLSDVVEAGLNPNQIAKESSGSTGNNPWQSPSKIQDWLSSTAGGVVVGGTQYLYRRSEIVDLEPFDLLVIEEAGQFSLANTISMATVTNRLLLVGDPQQLPQVTQGLHPEPVDESALGWLVNGEQVIDRNLGYFLPLSYRMVTELCEPVSNLSYRGQLKSAPDANLRALGDSHPGLHVIPIEHSDNNTYSSEEAAEVIRISQSLIGRQWTDEKGTRTLSPSDIKVVAPFNAQVSLIQGLLEQNDLTEIQVGTVDRFQGQQAPVVIVSMTTSTPSEVSRGLDFLLSRNRLNVAISRGQWATYLLYSPGLTQIDAKTPEEIRLVSGLLTLVRT